MKNVQLGKKIMKDFQLERKVLSKDHYLAFEISRYYWDRHHRIFKTHWHQYYEIIYMISGSCTCILNQNSFPLNTGDVLIANSNDLHTLDYIAPDTEYYVLLFSPSFFPSTFSNMANRIQFVNKVVNNKTIGEYLTTIFKEYTQKRMGYDLRMRGSLYFLCSYLLESFVLRQQEEVQKHQRKLRNSHRLEIVIQYIEQNYMNEISYKKLAGSINLSLSRFLHLFSDTLGIGIHEYIIKIRMEKAYDLLRNTELNVSQTAFSIGFRDPNYFSRAFKKHYNFSPSELIK